MKGALGEMWGGVGVGGRVWVGVGGYNTSPAAVAQRSYNTTINMNMYVQKPVNLE